MLIRGGDSQRGAPRHNLATILIDDSLCAVLLASLPTGAHNPTIMFTQLLCACQELLPNTNAADLRKAIYKLESLRIPIDHMCLKKGRSPQMVYWWTPDVAQMTLVRRAIEEFEATYFVPATVEDHAFVVHSDCPLSASSPNAGTHPPAAP